MEGLLDILLYTINTLVFIFTIVVISSYLILGILSIYALEKYVRDNKNVDYESILQSPFAPSVSIIAPAYNEAFTIVDNARSLLSLYYNDIEIIIVNDGSKDNSLDLMIEAYDMVKVDFYVEYKIECNNIRGVYKSRNSAFKSLILVDKDNGGKADALNAGINISSKELIACIDVDCVLEADSVLRMVKPFMESSDKQVIASGGVIRIANNCEFKDGKLVKVHLPKNIFAKIQVLEYIRAFLLGRMAWYKLDGLLIISGAFGMFDKQIAIEAGGYNHKTVGEDMELVVRMRRYMIEQKRKYTVSYIPDPLCWTEAPEDIKLLGRQRNRWTRGTIETLLLHKKMMFNPKYKLLGMLSFPYWLVTEWMSPLIEFFGIFYITFLAYMGRIDWGVYLNISIALYCFAVMFSTMAILCEEISYAKYENKKDFYQLILLGFIEPFFFHPLVVYWAIKGNIDFLRGKSSWGEMTRKGFKKS